MDLPVSPVFPDTPNGRKQQMLWRHQQRLLHAGRTPPHGAADGRPPNTRLNMDEEDSDDEVLPEEEETEDEVKSQLSRQSKSSRSSDRSRKSRNDDGTRTVRAIRRSFEKLNSSDSSLFTPAITVDDTTREAYREWLVTLANSVQELMFLEEDTDELDVFEDFQNFLPPDQVVRDTILLELQRTLSLRVQGPVSKEMRRLKKWGHTAPERLQHLHKKYYKAVDSGAAATFCPRQRMPAGEYTCDDAAWAGYA